jgi:hypothetical protein
LAVRQQDILGLDIAVNYAVSVGVIQSQRDFTRDAYGLPYWELLFPLEPISQTFALHIRHRIPEEACGFTGIEHRKEMGMLQTRGKFDLSQEALGTYGGCQIGAEHLECYQAIVFHVQRPVNRRHPPATKLASIT